MFNDPKVNQMRKPTNEEQDTFEDYERYGYEYSGKSKYGKGKKNKKPIQTAKKRITEDWKKDLNRKMLYIVYQYTRKE